jgi:hydrophobe/amphiphile efflux-1 (HAE1) family protein
VKFFQRFIDYPVMTTLVMAALVLFGLFGYTALPVSELPSVDFPTIRVRAHLPGADPETMASAVASPLENAFTAIPGIDNISSSSSQGSTSITIQFDLDRNIDGAAQDVQAAIQSAISQIPAMPTPPTFRKVNPNDIPVIFLVLQSKVLPLTDVDRYAESVLARQLSMLPGVAEVNVFGAATYAVRVQADPDALASRGIGINQLATAVAAVNVNKATGALNSAQGAAIIQATGQLNNAAAFRNQIVAYRKGAPVRLGDIARVVDSVDNVRQGNWWRGERAITVAVMRQPGANTIDVVNRIKAVLPHFRASLPAGIDLQVRHDRSETIRASIDNVQEALLVAAGMVVGVIFIFLRRIYATIIPSLALPIAIIGTFAGMSLAGFSLDNLSLMALTLSVGFVVDDAIVMLENIVRHIEHGEKPYDAAIKGSGEIGFTILSITISLGAVFIPIVFMGGLLGRLLHEFAVTIILAIFFSGVVSVTLTPMLCARILKEESSLKHGAWFTWSGQALDYIRDLYARSLAWALHHRLTIVGAFAASIVGSVILFQTMPQDFLPSDDTNMLRISVQAASGTSYQRMVAHAQRIGEIINNDPNALGAMVRVDSDGAGASSANITAMLKPINQRHLTADEVARELRGKFAHLVGVNVYVVNPPTIRVGGRGSRSTYQYTLAGLDFDQLQNFAVRLVQKLKATPGFVGVNSDNDQAMPSQRVEIDRNRAAALGVTPSQIETAMGYAFGGQRVSLIYESSNQYEVILELLPQFQRNAAAMHSLYVAGRDGNLVPLTAIAKIVAGRVPITVAHSGAVPAITVSFDLAEGYSLSDAVAGIERVNLEIGLPQTIQGSFQGTAAVFQSSTQNMNMLLIAAVIVVYIILGILYESFIHPLTILSGLPAAAAGALLTLRIVGMPLTIYAFVGMIMLIGIVKKNAIMMIDFAIRKQRSQVGLKPEHAIYEAALVRFRPIMMTTMAALMGTLPIAFGTGMGADSRRPLGVCVAGGLLLSQLLTLYITPVIYVYMDRVQNRIFSRRHTATVGPNQLPAE